MNQEKTVFDKYISQSKKKNRIGCLSLVLLISGCSSLITYHPGGANVVIGLLLLVGGGYLLWNYVIKPYFKPDNVFFDQVRDDLEKWARGEVEASYEKVFEVIKAPYVFGLNASYEHDKVDDKSELDIPLINYVEHIKEGDQKR